MPDIELGAQKAVPISELERLVSEFRNSRQTRENDGLSISDLAERLLDTEKQHVVALRPAKLQQAIDSRNLLGLALSGGGIRSATFSLGFIQALAERRLLRNFDYLSTVSGGGYIGSWLSSCIHYAQQRSLGDKAALALVEDRISANGLRADGNVEAPEIKFLRSYSSYLTPRLGATSGDTVALVSGMVRNFTLNLFIVLISLLLVIMATHLLLAAGLFMQDVMKNWGVNVFRFSSAINGSGYICLGLLESAMCMISMALTLQSYDLRQIKVMRARQRLLRIQVGLVMRLSLMAMFSSTIFMAFWFESRDHSLSFSDLAREVVMIVLFLLFGVILANVAIFVSKHKPTQTVASYLRLIKRAFASLRSILRSFKRNKQHVDIVSVMRHGTHGFFVLSGLAACALTAQYLCDNLLMRMPPTELDRMYFFLFGPTAVCLGYWLIYILFIGIVGSSYSEFTREYLNRLFGQFMNLAGIWLVMAIFIAYTRPAINWLIRNYMRFGSEFYLLHSIYVILLIAILATLATDRGPAIPVRKSFLTSIYRFASTIAVLTLILGVIAITTYAVQSTLIYLTSGPAVYSGGNDSDSYLLQNGSDLVRALQFQYEEDKYKVLFLLIGIPVIAFVGYWRIDVNIFSMQNLYRNRLVRCYLGAANYKYRVPNPYAGFDPRDDLELANFANQRPYPLMNAALNITRRQDLAWQQRKAASFLFSPLICGYWLDSAGFSSRRNLAEIEGGYALTGSYVNEQRGFQETSKGVMTGLAMATSGAAISSYMGFASKESRSFLITLFNMRLGRWLPNPKFNVSEEFLKKSSPLVAAYYYVRELMGATDARSNWIYVSDGGHFENTGIYELVRRRCQRIICIDAGADPKRNFGDLGNAIQKCRVDFGVDINIDTEPLRINDVSGISKKACSLGTIYYPAKEKTPPSRGILLYIKPSICQSLENLPTDIASYLSRHPQFPHEPTQDQWFTEAQFESYRKLGLLLGLQAIQDHGIELELLDNFD